jgi:hypothetical protein
MMSTQVLKETAFTNEYKFMDGFLMRIECWITATAGSI